MRSWSSFSSGFKRSRLDFFSEFVASRRAPQPPEGEERHGQRAGALLAAAAGPTGPVPGRQQGLRPLRRNHHPAGHVRLPPPDVVGLPQHRQAPQRPAASDPGGDARGETGVAGLSAAALALRVRPEACLTPRCCGGEGETGGRHVPGVCIGTGSLFGGGERGVQSECDGARSHSQVERSERGRARELVRGGLLL